MLRAASSRYLTPVYWLLPSLLCISLYWFSLKTWFLKDDFAWLGLRVGLERWQDWWTAIFAPTVHGTFRPLSERAFFLLFHELFQLDSLPYRIWILITFCADLVLIASITWRVTNSRAAGFWAPILWFVNRAMFVALGWTSAYMQILCGFFLLLAFEFLLRFAETGRVRYYYWQWAVFLIGFGAMETNLVYPALAASYAILCAPALLRKVLPMFVPSILFATAHMVLAPKQTSGPYAMHFDIRVLSTLWTYWGLALRSPWKLAALALWTVALLGFTVFQVWRRQRLPLVFLSWFAILLAPVLPLRDHISEYYLTLPLIGLSMLGAYGLASAFERSLFWKVVATTLVGAYLLANVPVARASSKALEAQSRAVRTMILGVRTAHELHPGKVLLLSGVNNELYWNGILDRPFRALGIADVYLTPGSEAGIRNAANPDEIVYPAALTARGLDRDEIEVYQVGPARLRNITSEYAATQSWLWDAGEPRRLSVTDPRGQYLLGTGWYASEGGFRWTAQRATLTIGGPKASGETLHVTGFCNPAQIQTGPLTMKVTVSGKELPPVPIRTCDQFQLQFDLPAEVTGRPVLELAIEADRPSHVPGDPREFGFAFSLFEIK